jgi:hypothetical protein
MVNGVIRVLKVASQKALVAADAALDWSRIGVIKQINCGTNWLQDQIYYAWAWLDGGSASRRLFEE